MSKPKIIIIEGAQGVGKGTITTMLRERIPHSTLIRLSGIKDNSIEGLEKVFTLRFEELCFLNRAAECETTFILDRSHLSEKVYCNLGYKNYDFIPETVTLNNRLGFLAEKYDVYVIGLILNDISLYEDRLKRDKAEINYSKFDINNSVKQQEEYIKEIKYLHHRNPNINCLLLNNSECLEEVFNQIISYCGVEL